MTKPNGTNGHHWNFSSEGTNTGKNPGSQSSNQFEFDIRLIWGILARHKYAILTITVIMGLVFAAYSYSLDPVYKSEGSILISETKTSYTPRDNGVSAMISSTMYGIGRENKLSDELQILQSRSLSMKMANKLIQNPIMENGGKYPVLWRNHPPAILRKYPEVWEKYPKNSATISQDTVAKRIQKNISFSQVEKSNLIKITYESISPYEAKKMVNLAIETYSNFSSSQNRKTAHSAVRYLEDEKERIRENLKNAEQRLRAFMDDENLVELDAQTNNLIKDMAGLESKIQTNKVKLVSVNSAIEQKKERLKNLKPNLSQTYSEAVLPKLDRFQYQLAELETEKMLMISRNPGIAKKSPPPRALQRLNTKISGLKKKISQMTQHLISSGNIGSSSDMAENILALKKELIKLKVEQSQYKAQNKVLKERLNEQQANFDQLPDNRIQLARLKREVEISEQQYKTVSRQYAEMKLLEQTRFGIGQPIDTGYLPDKPSGPNRLFFLLAGLFAGGILALGYICLREFTNRKVNRLDQVQKFNLPVLGLIPEMSGKKHQKLITSYDNFSKEAEAFRRLSNSVIHPKSGKKPQTIMITSYGKAEGDAEVSVNFAITLAEMDNNVLLMDFDYRRPDLHTFFGLEESPGIMECLYKQSDWGDIIQQTKVSGLDVLTPGREPSNTLKVNQSDDLHGILRELKKSYDHIILKPTPFGIITDSSPLIPLTDGVITVARFDKTREDELGELIHNLQDVNAHMLGMALTSFNYEKSLAYYAGYSRSYKKANQEYISNTNSKRKKKTVKAN